MEIQREKRKYDLLSMGEMLMRLSPPGNERLVCSDILEKKTGGAELNVSAGAALLGLKTGIISKLPSNALGLYIRNQVRFTVSATSLLCTTQIKTPVLAFITMRAEHIPVSLALSMTGKTLHSVK